MKRFTFKKWFEHYKPDEETTTILVNGYTQIVEPAFDFEETSLQAVSNYYLVGKAIDKLAEYEDAEEQGLLMRLPCKVGDEVFIIGTKCRSGRYEKWINTGKFRISDLEKLGKTVFLTMPEAEKALAEMEEEK